MTQYLEHSRGLLHTYLIFSGNGKEAGLTSVKGVKRDFWQMVQVCLVSQKRRDLYDGRGYQQSIILPRQILAVQILPTQPKMVWGFSFNHHPIFLKQTSAKCNWCAQGPWHDQKHALMTKVKTTIYCGCALCNTNSCLLPTCKRSI